MVKRLSTLVLCACLRIASGQIESNSVTVTAARTVNLQPDQASFTVTVNTPVSASPNDVIAALQGSGIGIANLVSVGPSNVLRIGDFTPAPFMATLDWNFSVTVPFTTMKTAFATLAAVANSVKQNNKDFTGRFAFSGAGVSQAALDAARQTVLPDLIADAKNRAKQLTDAAGLGLGAILSISELSTAPLLTSSTTPGSTITLAVKFALLRFN